MPIAPFPDPDRGSERGHLLFLVGVSAGIFASILYFELFGGRGDDGIELLRQVHDLTAETFVEGVEPSELVDDALHGMIDGLDTYSQYYGPEQISALKRETDGEFKGVGVVFRRPTSEAQVLFPFPGGPADRGGMRVGDRILEIGGVRVAEMENGGLQSELQRRRDGAINFLVQGLDGENRALAFEPERIVDPTVRHISMLDAREGVGYLSIYSFSHRTSGEFDTAVQKLQEEGLRALVLDLRNNPGGILDSAVTIANRFIAEGVLVSTRSRHETEVTRASSEDAHLAELDLVVLINSGSASASEVLAGALQDHARAALVGEPTYGKGTVQTLTPFGERAIVKLTTARYFTPAGRSIERIGDESHGLTPEVTIVLEKAVRDRIHAYLASYSAPVEVVPAIRAWEEASALELLPTRPQDPQLEVALQLLAGKAPETSGAPMVAR